jgi:hypothetical protein
MDWRVLLSMLLISLSVFSAVLALAACGSAEVGAKGMVLGGELLKVSDDEPIVEFGRMGNGVADYTDLGGSDVRHVVLDHGWRMVQVPIPLANFHRSSQHANGGE